MVILWVWTCCGYGHTVAMIAAARLAVTVWSRAVRAMRGLVLTLTLILTLALPLPLTLRSNSPYPYP